MGFELVALILGCFYISQYLETKYPSRGLIFVGLVFVSLIGWLIRVIWLLKKFQGSEDSEEDKS